MFRKACEAHYSIAPSHSSSIALPWLSNNSNHDEEHHRSNPNGSHCAKQPLSVGRVNFQKPTQTFSRGSLPHTDHTKAAKTLCIKRTSSGLSKAAASQDGFEYPTLPAGTSTQNAITLYDDIALKSDEQNRLPEVFYGSDDFESDNDLNLEDPTKKDAIHYPILPIGGGMPSGTVKMSKECIEFDFEASSQKHHLVHDTTSEQYPTIQHKSFNEPEASRKDSFKVKAADLSLPNSSAPMPWSSSPVDHFRTPPKAKAEASNTVWEGVEAGNPRPSKRRTLPWVLADEERPKPHDSTLKDSRKTRNNTVPTDWSGPITPQVSRMNNVLDSLDASTSAIKEQQKKFREANRKSIKLKAANSIDLSKKQRQKRFSSNCAVCLSEEQENILNMVAEGQKSVFFTGSAGTGKSVLLREIIAALKKKHIREPDRVAVTASTGLAACNIGGVTLHSFAGIGLGKESAEDLVKKIKKNQKAKHRWMRTKVLVIDEVSMIDAELFDKLEQIARTLRNNGRPFGGIQVVITGDFFQLPPVVESSRVSKFCFDAGTWNTTIEHTIGLHHVFRQKDPAFAAMLNEMREGLMSNASIAVFKRLERQMDFDDDIEATELFPTRAEVDRANYLRMARLHGDVRVFTARDGGSLQDLKFRDKILQNCIAPEVIQLKKGAQVMLIKNLDETLVNGTIGKVVNFMSEQTYAYMGENEEDASAIQAADYQDLNPSERKFKDQISREKPDDGLPVVKFTLADGSTRQILCTRESWKTELPNGEVQASRSQVPLILAWALSIHKAQGQTLERVKVDLGKVFEKGQAYVALSRATSMQGLQVLRFDAKKVMAHDRVRNFYRKLEKAAQSVESTGEDLNGTEHNYLTK